MSCLQFFLSSVISSVMFNFLMSSSTTLLQVFFGLPTGYLPSTSSSIALLSMLFSSLCFTWSNHLNLVFLNLCSRFSTPHLLLTFSFVILLYHLILDMYLDVSQQSSQNKTLYVQQSYACLFFYQVLNFRLTWLWKIVIYQNTNMLFNIPYPTVNCLKTILPLIVVHMYI